MAFALETGVRWMCLKNVSVDVSFKYRNATAHYEYTARGMVFGNFHTITWNPTYNLFSVQVGAAYHF